LRHSRSHPIRRQKSELVISEVSERMVRIEVAPLDEQQRPRTGTPSTAFVSFPTTEKLRTRELAEKEIRAGQLRVTIQAATADICGAPCGRQTVQELILRRRNEHRP
jgi:hypothetical protein